jgi:FkbM family methyltransferase
VEDDQGFIQIELDSSTKVYALPGSRAEVRLIYKEIFSEDCYFRHGIQLEEDDVVVDVGANIGMFAAKVLRSKPRVRYLGLEPVPRVFECLSKNIEQLGKESHHQIRILNVGLSNCHKDAEIEFLPVIPGSSTLFPHAKWQHRQAAWASLRLKEVWLLHKGLAIVLFLIYPLRRRFADWLQKHQRRGATKVRCSFTTLGEFMKESKIGGIGLLKIDVEGSEIDVLEGATDAELNAVRQLVMEIAPYNKQRIPVLRERLERCGFRKVYVESPAEGSDPQTDSFPCTLFALKA